MAHIAISSPDHHGIYQKSNGMTASNPQVPSVVVTTTTNQLVSNQMPNVVMTSSTNQQLSNQMPNIVMTSSTNQQLSNQMPTVVMTSSTNRQLSNQMPNVVMTSSTNQQLSNQKPNVVMTSFANQLLSNQMPNVASNPAQHVPNVDMLGSDDEEDDNIDMSGHNHQGTYPLTNIVFSQNPAFQSMIASQHSNQIMNTVYPNIMSPIPQNRTVMTSPLLPNYLNQYPTELQNTIPPFSANPTNNVMVLGKRKRTSTSGCRICPKSQIDEQISSGPFVNSGSVYAAPWYYLYVDGITPEISLQSSLSQRYFGEEDCKSLLSKLPTIYWEICHLETWHILGEHYSSVIEENYCNVDNDLICVDPLDPNSNENKNLLPIFGTKPWKINFKTMIVKVSKYSFKIRRLSAPSSAISTGFFASEFEWYFKKGKYQWMKFEENNDEAVPNLTSQDIENHYCTNNTNKPLVYQCQFVVDTKKMTIQNIDTRIIMEIKRRPKKNKPKETKELKTPDEDKQYPDHWVPMTTPPVTYEWYFKDECNQWIKFGLSNSRGSDNHVPNITSADIEKHYTIKKNMPLSYRSSDQVYLLDFNKMTQRNTLTNTEREVKRCKTVQSTCNLDELDKSSEEFKELSRFFKSHLTKAKLVKIQRIQNPFLWSAYKNKKEKMLEEYGDASLVNEQRMFHGTERGNIETIIQNNLDWRLFGQRNGAAFGQGTYFSNSAVVSNNFCDKVGNKVMILANVLLGSYIAGDSNTVRPPLNPSTGRLYDTTVNCIINPTIFVKYDSQEYYPDYIIEFS